MRTIRLRQFVALLILFIAIVSCEKEGKELIAPDQDPASTILIKTLVENANGRFVNSEVIIGQDNASFIIENDGLIDEYIAGEDGFADNRKKKNIFLDCLRSVEPDREQRQSIKRALQAYSERNNRIIGAHRRNFANLRQRIEVARRDLDLRFEAGEIDRNQYRREMIQLRERFQEAITRIRNSNAEAFSSSYTILLEHLYKILSEEQWRLFTDC